MYGIVVNDPTALHDDNGQAGRTSLLAEDHSAYAMIRGAPGVLARSFDAAAVVTTGWAAPVTVEGTIEMRPSRHPQRRRVRAVAVVDDAGVASVVRFEDDPGSVIGGRERGTGEVVDALELMWFGEPARPGDMIVNMRPARGGCTRWP